jgi:plastocyanin
MQTLVIGLIILFSLVLFLHHSTQAAYTALAQEQQHHTSNRTTLVGAGGSDALWDDYVPQNIEINIGDSVTWQNPSPVTEPHTVTIINNDTLIPPLAAPFAVSNSTTLQPLIPNDNVEPLIIPPQLPNQQKSDGMSGSQNKSLIVMIDNARAYNPVVIDPTGKNITHLPPNANYSMNGSESYVNSGFIFPMGQEPPGLPPTNTFTITFENPGTIEYICVLHPWMTGTVTVG